MAKNVSTTEVFDSLFLGKEEIARRKKVRERKSYIFWKRQYGLLKTNRFTKKQSLKLLDWLYTILNSRGGWGTATNASYARESLDLFIQDKEDN